MKAKFVELNGRVSIHVCTEDGDAGEQLLLKLFLDQLHKPEMMPLMIVASGSALGDSGEARYRYAQFGQYAKSEVGE